ncbi:Trihelix transcription factor [Quillaja saponaria]|uniref:Trihelix transcription factor n=1 Tax=Quillaja saponaria TaxID=32244 RepID=A0AAD7M4L5_QUISA|nr:Trihelix transcription factor [Quillaja saponaria]
MDGIEDDARYPPKSYALNRYNASLRQKRPTRSAPYSRPVTHRYEDDDEEELEGFNVENDLEDDEDEEEDDGENGYGPNFEEDEDFVRNPKKKKLRNSSVSGYEFAPRVKYSYGSRSSSDEWTEHATFVLLEVWGDRFLQLGRKSLRSEDWNEVSEKVSEELKMERTEAQCRNMLDKLKRRYKKEKARMEDMRLNSSKWAYFKKMDMLMASSPKQEYGLACGVDSGEYVFMNTRVYLNRSNGFDEMRDSPGESETSEEENDSEGLPPRRAGIGGDHDDLSFSVLADSIQKFGKIYEKIENSKRQQMMELEKMRLDFHRDLELQKKQILERAQAEIAKIQEADDEDTDASAENLSE